MSDTFVRRAPTPQELRRDLILGAVLLVAGMISAALTATAGIFGFDGDKLGWAVLGVTVNAVAISVRRRFPLSVAVVTCVTYFLMGTFGAPEMYVGNVAMFMGIYTVGAWVNDRRRANIVRIALIIGMFVWLLVSMFVAATNPPEGVDETYAGFTSPMLAWMIIQLLLNCGYFGAAFYLGDRAYSAARQRHALRERQRELEHEREVTAAQAVALDRIAIARELHDVVAHHVSAMGVQAGAARAVLNVNPEGAATALQNIEQSARSAISELRNLLETLRSPASGGANDAPSTLRLSHIGELVETATKVGMPSTLTVVGEPREVPDIVQVNLYRITQEALTNARRHGGPNATADVRLRYSDDAVEVEIANSGWVPTTPRAGLGQLGMRERAAASGGTIEIGPRPRGGFLVRARVPLVSGEVPA